MRGLTSDGGDTTGSGGDTTDPGDTTGSGGDTTDPGDTTGGDDLDLGACCVDDTCIELDESTCKEDMLGVWSPGLSCDDADLECGPETGACCVEDTCYDMTFEECEESFYYHQSFQMLFDLPFYKHAVKDSGYRYYLSRHLKIENLLYYCAQ